MLSRRKKFHFHLHTQFPSFFLFSPFYCESWSEFKYELLLCATKRLPQPPHRRLTFIFAINPQKIASTRIRGKGRASQKGESTSVRKMFYGEFTSLCVEIWRNSNDTRHTSVHPTNHKSTLILKTIFGSRGWTSRRCWITTYIITKVKIKTTTFLSSLWSIGTILEKHENAKFSLIFFSVYPQSEIHLKRYSRFHRLQKIEFKVN